VERIPRPGDGDGYRLRAQVMERASKTIGELSPQEIRELVRQKYSEVALHPRSKFKFRVGSRYAYDLGYPVDAMDTVPEVLAESFTGVSSFLARSEQFAEGETILELGTGGGLDTALLARRVGPSGRVLGLDLSLGMAVKANAGLGALGLSNGYSLQAEAERIPLPDGSMDWVVSNGIFNLSPEKKEILAEMHRVLKPGGRVLCSEIVLKQDPAPEQRNNEEDWFK